MLTQAELKRQLHYDPETGLFTRLISNNFRVKVGDIAGNINKSTGYVQLMVNHKLYSGHRLAWFYVYGEWPKEFLDHVNRVKTDNRICNLREVTNQQNQWNIVKQINNKTGYLGVTTYGKRYVAHINIDGKRTHLGSFKDAKSAHHAYMAAKSVYHVI